MTSLSFPSDPPARRPVPRRALVEIEVYVSEEEATVVIAGELDLTTGPLLTEHLTPILRSRPRRLIVDLAGTVFMDCSSARLIVSAGRFLPDAGRPIIRHPSRGVRRVLELTGFDAYCEIEA